MTPTQFRKAVETLARNDPGTYGRGWQSALARVVGVTDRTVRDWVSGRSPITQAMEMLIERLVKEAMFKRMQTISKL